MGVLDPDAMVRSNMPDSGAWGLSSIDAGRIVLQLAREMLEKRQSFVVETTLSGTTYLRMMREAKAIGYQVELLFIGTASVDVTIERIRTRLIKGGHDISTADQRRRFPRSMKNLQAAFSIADVAILDDNSTAEGFAWVASKQLGGVVSTLPLPTWAAFVDGHNK